MKNKKCWKSVVKVFLWIVGVLAVVAVSAVLIMRFVIVPKITQKLRDKGMDEIAVFVEDNNKVSTMLEVAEIATDKGVVELLTKLDGAGKSSAVGVLDDIEKEVLGESVKQEPQKPEIDDKELDAYEKISKEASQKEMSDGLAIIRKLDISYIVSLLSEGLTAEEKGLIKSHVYQRLTRAEISRALELYQKYKKYL